MSQNNQTLNNTATSLVLALNKSAPVLNLTKAQTLDKIQVTVSWDMRDKALDGGIYDYDLDLYAVVLNTQDKILNAQSVVYFNNKKFEEAIELPKDERSGGSEDINIELSKLPSWVQSIDLLVGVFESEERKQTLSEIKNGKVSIKSINSGGTATVIQEYSLADYTGAFINVGRIHLSDNVWKVLPNGDESNEKTINGILTQYV
jgi:tellurium resistance protein TerD